MCVQSQQGIPAGAHATTNIHNHVHSYSNVIIILMFQLSVCLCMCVSPEGHRKLLDLTEEIVFLCKAVLGCYRSSSLSLTATAVANAEVSRWRRAVRKVRLKYKLTCGGQVMREEPNLGVDIVHGWFSGDDSILSIFFASLL